MSAYASVRGSNPMSIEKKKWILILLNNPRPA